MNPIDQLERFARAFDGREVFGADEVLPYAVKAIQLIGAHPDAKSAFEDAFIRMSAYAPPEFIEICMHELRWPNVRDEFSRRQSQAIAENDWRAEPIFRSYLSAFEDDWSDAGDFYASYFRGRPGH